MSGIILAAGKSTRMGRLKQLLPLNGRPLLQHVIDAAAASRLDEIVVVLGHRAEEIGAAIGIRRGARVVVNPDFATGQASSLQQGLRCVSSNAAAAAVLLGDQPQISVALIDHVVEAFAKGRAPILRPIFTTPDGRAPGHPVVLARSVWSEVMQLSGDEGARSLMSTHPEWVREVTIAGATPKDVDTWADYEAL